MIETELRVPEMSVGEMTAAAGAAMGGCGKKMPGESAAGKKRRTKFRHGMYDPGIRHNRIVHRQVLRFRNLVEQSLETKNGTEELTIAQAMLVTSATRCEQVIQVVMVQLSECESLVDVDKIAKLNGQVLKSVRMRDWYLMQLGLTEKVKLDLLDGAD